jgi:chaperonin GroES
MAHITPLSDRVLIKRLESEQKTAAGIIIPDTAQEKTQLGSVIAVGSGRVAQDGNRKPLSVKEGDTVLFGKFSGTEVKYDGQEYLILKEDEVLGIVQK